MEQLDKKTKVKKFGEVFTPPRLVNEMLDKLPPELWLDSTKKWLDNSCGKGAFLLEVRRRLMDAGHSYEHINKNMIYGVELQEDNARYCVEELKFINIVCRDALTYDYEFLESDLYEV